MDDIQPNAEAIAVRNGRFIFVGNNLEVEKFIDDDSEIIDADNQFIMPGLIEGHGHFSNLGFSLLNLNFLQSKNWEEIVAMVGQRAAELQPGEWIEGRGWHQEKWDHSPERNILGYPFHDDLSAVSPDNPVVLYHASGHGLFANKKAMDIAGISRETPDPSGGAILRDAAGDAIGVFEERAMNAIYTAHQDYLATLPPQQQLDRWYQAIELAEKECLKNGITSFQDAGSSFEEIERYREMAEKGELDLRLWVMLRRPYSEMKKRIKEFPIIDAGDHFFSCRAIKSEVDGALGSYGAWLLEPYHDKPGFHGQNTTSIDSVVAIAELAAENDLQLCVHAIGDRANQEVLDIFEETFNKYPEKKDWRWRIEHAQHLHPEDIPRFKNLSVIASMQGVHCTSDAPFVEKRLGEKRAKEGAYAWRSLIDQGARLANGTDAPVEDVNPFASLYASVSRTRSDNGLKFFTEQSMTRDEALKSYTIWNAYAAFEEKDKGSIEVGKLADFIVISNNLLECSEEDILNTKAKLVFINGIKVN